MQARVEAESARAAAEEEAAAILSKVIVPPWWVCACPTHSLLAAHGEHVQVQREKVYTHCC